MNKLTIGGKEYPCRMTMGAMVEFKNETGMEVTDIEKGGMSAYVTFIWCCVRSACRADAIAFDLSIIEMADLMDLGDFARLQSELFALQPVQGQEQKKRRP